MYTAPNPQHPTKEPMTTPIPYHADDRVTLWHGDCLDVLAGLLDASIDAIVTDPPYGLSKEPDMAEVMRHWLAGDDYVHGSRPDSLEDAFSKAVKALAVRNPDDTNTQPGYERITFRVRVDPPLTAVLRPVDLDSQSERRQEEVNGNRPIREVDDLLSDDRNAQAAQRFSSYLLGGRITALQSRTVTRERKRSLLRVGVRLGDDTSAETDTPPGVVASPTAELIAVLALDVAGRTGELLPAEGAGQSHFILHPLSSKTVRTSTGAGGLTTVGEPDFVGPIDDSADGAFTIDVAVDLPIGWHKSQSSSMGGFMGKSWDSFVPGPSVWRECFRVLKPGGHLLSFAGSRTFDLMGLSIRLAGFEIRDSIAWLYGSGFPKSMDVSKAIDKRGGRPDLGQVIGVAIKTAREARGWTTGQADRHFCGGSTNWTWYEGRKGVCRPPTPTDFARIVEEWPELASHAANVAEAEREITGSGTSGRTYGMGGIRGVETSTGEFDITSPATPEAEQWQGWGTALKPAFEPIVVARKPIRGTVAANVLEHGTGALNIDGCRIDGAPVPVVPQSKFTSGNVNIRTAGRSGELSEAHPAGRWPANVCLDEDQAAALDQQSGILSSGGPSKRDYAYSGPQANGIYGAMQNDTVRGHPGDGGASRFFLVMPIDELTERFRYQAKAPKKDRPTVDGISHATVKPLALMRWLVRLVTPIGGTILEPFAGSGTTVEAALLEGFKIIAIEREADYLPLITQRINRRRDPIAYLTEAGDDIGLFGEVS